MKSCVIRQPAGMGDIFMCLKIAKVYHDMGYNIVWPIYPQYLYLNDYLNIDFKFISTGSEFIAKDIFISNPKRIVETNEYVYLPLEVASHVVGEPVMDAKYRLVNIDIDDYLDYFSFRRNKDREDNLYHNDLDLLDISSYRLCNKNYASLPDVRTFDRNFVITNRNLYDVHMTISPYTNLFDWCKAVENCKEFHTVGTSITFIAEKLDLKAEQIFMYRRPEAQMSNFTVERKLFKKPWNFIA